MNNVEDGAALLVLPPDFPYGDLQEIATILERDEVFVPGYIPPPVGLYDVDGFIYHAWVERSETILLPDRNIASRMAQVAKGQPVAGKDNVHRRRAAAILAFAQCLDIQLEPSIAFHELAPNQGNESAYEELAWLRIADNGNCHEWVAAALGRVDRIRSVCTPPKIQPYDLAKPLRRWRRNYAVALKIAALELTPDLKPIDRVLTLFQWMRDDFLLAGPAAMLACIYFAPNAPPRDGLLKRLRSPKDRERAIEGIINAAWDITHLSDFVRRINEEPEDNPRRFIFATTDSSLRAIAGLVLSQNTEPAMTASETLAASLSQWWPKEDASRIAETWGSHIERSRSADWWRQYQGRDYVGEVITQGEAQIRAWRPSAAHASR